MLGTSASLSVRIVRFVREHQPPIVAAEMLDAAGQRHEFIEKVWMLSDETLDEGSSYPQEGAMRCSVLDRWRDAGGHELARISTADPDVIESTTGRSEFIVPMSQLSECAPSSRA